jgi:glutamate dehydrogenase/leucine dehydrogenase
MAGTREIPCEDVLTVDCDILLPSALENAITMANVGSVKARIIAELANGPTTPGADRVFADAGVFIVPDILANAGGVIVSYFEWVQDLQNFFWSEDEINNKLKEMLSRAFHDVLTFSKKEGVSLRLAALMIAVQRVGRAMLLRGLYA